jgi:hypothetical protein
MHRVLVLVGLLLVSFPLVLRAQSTNASLTGRVNTLSDPFFGQSTRTLASSLGSGGANGGFNPLYQIGGPRSIQLALKLQF